MPQDQKPVPVVLSDVDGTLLEPDGQPLPEVLQFLAVLRNAGVVVCPVTSKTPAELARIMNHLGLSAPAGFENGAGIRLQDGQWELQPTAVPLGSLMEVLNFLRQSTGLLIRSLFDLEDHELAFMTGLPREELPAARQRVASLPLVVDPRWDPVLQGALPPRPRVRLLRGNRFLHLQGAHGKAQVVPRLFELVGRPWHPVVACGDSPNDEELLAVAAVKIIVPSREGPHPWLCQRFPDALIPTQPHGRGWVQALQQVFPEIRR